MSDQAATPTLIFDGACGFCTTSAEWLGQRFREGERVTAGQLFSDHDLQILGLARTDVQEAAWWVDANGSLARGHRAIGKALHASGGGRRVAGWLVLTPPTSWLAGALYSLVVRWRYRLPGAGPACRIASDATRGTR